MKKFLAAAAAALLVLVVAAAAGDTWLAHRAERHLAERVRQHTDAASASAEIETPSVLWSAVTGSVDGVRLDIVDARRDGVEVSRLRLALRDVTFDRAAIFGAAGRAHAASATLSVELPVAALVARLGPEGKNVRLLPSSSGIDAIVDVPFAGEVRVAADFAVESGALVVRFRRTTIAGVDVPLPGLFQPRYPLPDVPESTELTSSSVSDGRLRLEFSCGPVTIEPTGQLADG